MTQPVRVRIAPSPTGEPHVGTAYVALFNLAFTRQQGGTFILRIEDTDRLRSKPEHEQAILDTLTWAGLSWDEGPDKGGPHAPYRQSERSDLYRQHAGILLDKGAAYRCFCTAEDLDQMRKEREAKKLDSRYDGRCRRIERTESDRRAASGEAHVVRLLVPTDGATSFRDEIRGEITVANAEIDDQVLLKSDGFPTYHLANVVDDALMGVTHVIRGGDWIVSTPKHVILYDAFGWSKPVFAHLPLLLNPDKTKISKRKSPTSLLWYKEQGFLPQALLNFLGLLGYSLEDGEEVFDLDKLSSTFALDRIKASNAVFDLTKLEWLNGVYLRQLSPADLARTIREFGGTYPPNDTLEKAIPLIQERIKTLSEVEEKVAYLRTDRELEYDPALLLPKNHKDPAEVTQVLDSFREALTPAPTMATTELESLCMARAEAWGWKKGDFFMALRVAVTGSTVSPPLCESMEILGKDEVLKRVDAAVVKLESLVEAG